MKNILLFIIFLCFFSCKNKDTIIISESISVVLAKNSKLSDEETRNWHFKDIFEDTIPGISLEKAYRELLKDKKGKEVVVAIIDTEIDIFHDDLKDQIWVNPEELDNNGKDDDNNGYVDDIHGWNFLGNSVGKNLIHSNYEFVRIIKKYKPIFEDKSIDSISSNQKEDYEIYQKALKALGETLKNNRNYLKRLKKYLKKHLKAKEILKPYFSIDSITKKQLLVHKTQDTIIKKHIETLINHIDRGITEEILLNSISQTNGLINLSANFDYKEREIIGDNPNDITDTNYGNNNVSGNINELYHGTIVAGVLASKRNNFGSDGITNEVKIMPLCVSSNGDELDKDIALAIRYAVDNGAKIINMSSGKRFSMNRDWVNDAIQYAVKKDVLFVTSAGNNKLDLDDKENNYYPNNDNNDEVRDSFLMVGASSYTLDKRLRLYLTNYGKDNVDIFAPGYKVYTTFPNNKYQYSQGTSIATPIVVGVAALLMSHYPDLKASQIKEILMKSGISYNIDVEMFRKDDTKKMVPFSELSKSGKVVNAYNALLMAEQVSKNKK